MKQTEISNLVLGREEVYKASPRIWSFKFTDDIVNGINLNLSNMVSAYPFEYGGYHWKDSERLYLCGEFSTSSEQDFSIQQRLVNSVSGYAAKRFVKSPNKRFVRADFPSLRLQWMLFVVWQKCRGNADFRKLLMQVPNDVILVENTTTDKGGSAEIWGCRNRELVEYRKMNEEYGYVKDLLFGSQRIFIDNDTLLKYGHYEIGYMPHADWLRYCDMIVARLCHDTDNETSKIIAKNEEVMQVFCWGAMQAIKRREQTLKGE